MKLYTNILIAAAAVVLLTSCNNKQSVTPNPSPATDTQSIDSIQGTSMTIESEETAESVAVEENENQTASSSEDMAQVKIINIDAGSFYYKPNQIKVAKGQQVKIVMTSKDMMHDFNIDELKVNMPIVKSGNTGMVEFTPEKAGTYEFYCSVGQHRANGQVGTLVVE